MPKEKSSNVKNRSKIINGLEVAAIEAEEKAKETINIISKKMRHPKDVPNRRRVIDRKTETT